MGTLSNLARAARYAARKGTPEHEAEQAQARAEAYEAILSMTHPETGQSYTPARARRAVTEYAAASRDTRLGPDWPGFLRLVERHGLA